jgi:hypothetical protein
MELTPAAACIQVRHLNGPPLQSNKGSACGSVPPPWAAWALGELILVSGLRVVVKLRLGLKAEQSVHSAGALLRLAQYG